VVLKTAHYTQGAAFECEKHQVFAREWLPIAVREQLAQPGQYVSAAPGGWPMLAACGADGVLRAFRNLCRHRDLQLARQDAGNCEKFHCRHHGWTYDLTGTLVDAPAAAAPPGAMSQQRLLALGLQPWGALILVNWQAHAAPIAGVADTLWTAGKSQVGARMVDAACNWKTLLELLLPGEEVSWLWPLLVLRREQDVTIVDRIIPRVPMRTRLIRHIYAGEAARHAVQPALAVLDRLKDEAQQLQAARAQGVPAERSHPHVAELHARLAAAYAQAGAS